MNFQTKRQLIYLFRHLTI